MTRSVVCEESQGVVLFRNEFREKVKILSASEKSVMQWWAIVIPRECGDGPAGDGGWMGTGCGDARLGDRGLRMLEDTSMNTLTFHEYQSVWSNMNRLWFTAWLWYSTPQPSQLLTFTLNFEFPSKYLSSKWYPRSGSSVRWKFNFSMVLEMLFIFGIMKLEKDWISNFHPSYQDLY